MTIACLAAWALALLLMPILFIAWLTESQSERVRRLHRSGLSQRRIAQQLGISRHKVAKALA
jgi:DNA-binding CsgD family transcriptional regulator